MKQPYPQEKLDQLFGKGKTGKQKEEKKAVAKPTVSKIDDPKRKLDMKRLMKEAKCSENKGLNMKSQEILRSWQELFYVCYQSLYTPDGKEKGMTRRLCKDILELDIKMAMSCMFFELLSNDWYVSRNIVPCLEKFVKNFNYWKSKSYAKKDKMSKIADATDWWLINEAGLDVDKLPGDEVVFKTELVSGRVKLHVLRDKRIMPITFSGR